MYYVRFQLNLKGVLDLKLSYCRERQNGSKSSNKFPFHQFLWSQLLLLLL